jgi:hypothetical protein
MILRQTQHTITIHEIVLYYTRSQSYSAVEMISNFLHNGRLNMTMRNIWIMYITIEKNHGRNLLIKFQDLLHVQNAIFILPEDGVNVMIVKSNWNILIYIHALHVTTDFIQSRIATMFGI